MKAAISRSPCQTCADIYINFEIDGAAETERATESEALEQGTTVYRTPTGKKYHLQSSCAGKNADAITLEAALAAGLGPCGSWAD